MSGGAVVAADHFARSGLASAMSRAERLMTAVVMCRLAGCGGRQ
jgi:hypothetical protein